MGALLPIMDGPGKPGHLVFVKEILESGKVVSVIDVCYPLGKAAEALRYKGRITVMPGATNDREVIEKAVAGCDGALTVPYRRNSNDNPNRRSITS